MLECCFPYILLFDGMPCAVLKLPIKEIYIGPHPNELDRQHAIQMLLNELDLDITVSVFSTCN